MSPPSNKPRRQRQLALFTSLAVSFAPVYAYAQAFTASENDVRGVVKAQNEAVLTVDLAAPVAETPFRTGQAFQKGDILIRFDCDRQKAEAAAAAASYAAATVRHNSNLELEMHDAIGAFEVEMSHAELNENDARARAMRARLKPCEIKAPYDGNVAELLINAHETPRADQPVMKIVGGDAPELRLIVPSKWLVWLKPGALFTFDIDETGGAHMARVVRIGAEVDAVSRTVPIIAEFADATETVRPGMSGTAHFEPPAG